MKAAFIDKFGAPEGIRFDEFPTPVVGDSDVLVSVAAVTVNPIDTYIRAGAFDAAVPLPFIIGRDMTGVVEAVGRHVTSFRRGDRVWANNQGYHGRQGTFAEFCCVQEELLYRLPPEADLRDSVAVVHSGLTALLGLRLRAAINPGETIFINGGDGNVGSAVLQFAKAAGARAIVTSAHHEKAAWSRELGADLVINYRKDDVVRTVLDFCPGGVDVYWDASATPDATRALEMTARRARLVFMAGLKHRTTLPVGAFYSKNLTLYGFTATDATTEELSVCADEINRALQARTLRPRIAARLPLSSAAEAHHLIENTTQFGKIVLLPDPGEIAA
ncbi:MAG TPA: NADPH:quinone reductase [Bryobacteraceae bacterium]|nr:NADPH:quinone reductase [Bryobacteraceae bacterium]